MEQRGREKAGFAWVTVPYETKLRTNSWLEKADELQKALHELCMTVGEVVVERRFTDEMVIGGRGNRYNKASERLIRKDQLKAIRRIFAAFEDCVNNAYERGREDGNREAWRGITHALESVKGLRSTFKKHLRHEEVPDFKPVEELLSKMMSVAQEEVAQEKREKGRKLSKAKQKGKKK